MKTRILLDFYEKYVSETDRLIMSLVFLSILIGLAMITANYLGSRYTGNFYLPIQWIVVSPFMTAVTLFGLWAHKTSPRLSEFTRTYGLYFFIFFAFGVLSTGTQFAPFPTIDKSLIHLDELVGFNSMALLNWTYAAPHAWLLKIFRESYFSLYPELMILPFIIIFLKEKKSLDIYFIALLLMLLISCAIYYFFPTGAPTSVFQNIHFTNEQHQTYLKFYEVHHHLPLTTYGGGMIAFPSCHVAWALLLVYLCKTRKWLFYPILIWNTIIILGTMFLGWHYLVDVLGGTAVATIAILAAHALYQKRSARVCGKSTVKCRFAEMR